MARVLPDVASQAELIPVDDLNVNVVYVVHIDAWRVGSSSGRRQIRRRLCESASWSANARKARAAIADDPSASLSQSTYSGKLDYVHVCPSAVDIRHLFPSGRQVIFSILDDAAALAQYVASAGNDNKMDSVAPRRCHVFAPTWARLSEQTGLSAITDYTYTLLQQHLSSGSGSSSSSSSWEQSHRHIASNYEDRTTPQPAHKCCASS